MVVAGAEDGSEEMGGGEEGAGVYESVGEGGVAGEEVGAEVGGVGEGGVEGDVD